MSTASSNLLILNTWIATKIGSATCSLVVVVTRRKSYATAGLDTNISITRMCPRGWNMHTLSFGNTGRILAKASYSCLIQLTEREKRTILRTSTIFLQSAEKLSQKNSTWKLSPSHRGVRTNRPKHGQTKTLKSKVMSNFSLRQISTSLTLNSPASKLRSAKKYSDSYLSIRQNSSSWSWCSLSRLVNA